MEVRVSGFQGAGWRTSGAGGVDERFLVLGFGAYYDKGFRKCTRNLDFP